jgi:hypothetical protein
VQTNIECSLAVGVVPVGLGSPGSDSVSDGPLSGSVGLELSSVVGGRVVLVLSVSVGKLVVVPSSEATVVGVSPVDDSFVSVGSLLGSSEASGASGVSGVALSLSELLSGLLEGGGGGEGDGTSDEDEGLEVHFLVFKITITGRV